MQLWAARPTSLLLCIYILQHSCFSQLSTGVSEKLQKTLTWEEIDIIQNDAMRYVTENDDVIAALNYMIDRYQEQLVTSAPAYWLLVANMALLVLCFLFMTCQYHQFVGGPPTGAFKEGLTNKAIGLFFRIITGLILIEFILRAMLFLDTHLQIWHVIIMGGLAIGGFVFLVLSFN